MAAQIAKWTRRVDHHSAFSTRRLGNLGTTARGFKGETMSHSSRIQFLAWALALLAWGPASGAEPILELRPSRTIEFGRQSTTDKAPVISSVSLDPAGTMLATAGDDHLARIWDARDGQLLQCLAGHDDWVRSVAFSPNGQTLATAVRTAGSTFGKSRPAAPTARSTIPWKGFFVLVFSPDSRLLAAGGFESKVRIHDGRSGDLLQVLDVPGGDTCAMAFSSPNGGYLAAAGRGGCIRIWSTVSGQQDRGLERPSAVRQRDCLVARREAIGLRRR